MDFRLILLILTDVDSLNMCERRRDRGDYSERSSTMYYQIHLLESGCEDKTQSLMTEMMEKRTTGKEEI